MSANVAPMSEHEWSTAAAAAALHAAYKPLYREAMQAYRQGTGRASGWQPDAPFLQALAPEQPEARTMEQLEAIAAAIRRLQSGRWQQSSAIDQELAEQVAEAHAAED